MIEEVIFDCFGVLTQDGWTAFINKYANKSEMDDLSAANALADKGLISYAEFLERVSDITGVAESVAHTMVTSSLHPNEPVFALANQLAHSYKLGIISNVGSPLEHYFPEGYLSIFQIQTLSFQEGLVKPGPEIFKRHLERSGVVASRAVFIDDRRTNCDGARAAGLKAIHFQNVDQLAHDLAALGVSVGDK